jgi:hypothetical protein
MDADIEYLRSSVFICGSIISALAVTRVLTKALESRATKNPTALSAVGLLKSVV